MTKKQKYLLNAAKRRTITLCGIMVTIQYGDKTIKCDSAEEAERILRFIDEQQKKEKPHQLSVLDLAAAELFELEQKNPWNIELFWKFIESLGDPQKKILWLLFGSRQMEDKELRDVLKIETNKQLAGILSGLSKQAANLGIPARSVFLIKNESSKGVLSKKTYMVAPEFSYFARESNWDEG
jgi:hypothetical protein